MKSDFCYGSWRYAEECGIDGIKMKIHSPSFDKGCCCEPQHHDKKQDSHFDKKPEFPCFDKKECWDHKPEFPCWDHKPEFPCWDHKPQRCEKRHCPKCFPCCCCPCRPKFSCPLYQPVKGGPQGGGAYPPPVGHFPPGGQFPPNGQFPPGGQFPPNGQQPE